MSRRTEAIEQKLSELEPSKLEIVDDSAQHAGHAGARESGGGHYSVNIVSTHFANLNSVKRHQLVYKALGDMMQKEIHALRINALTPDEFSKQS